MRKGYSACWIIIVYKIIRSIFRHHCYQAPAEFSEAFFIVKVVSSGRGRLACTSFNSLEQNGTGDVVVVQFMMVIYPLQSMVDEYAVFIWNLKKNSFVRFIQRLRQIFQGIPDNIILAFQALQRMDLTGCPTEPILTIRNLENSLICFEYKLTFPSLQLTELPQLPLVNVTANA
jgi:hypothetical protein